MQTFKYNINSFILSAARWIEVADLSQLHRNESLSSFDRESMSRWETLLQTPDVFRFSLDRVDSRIMHDTLRNETFIIERNLARFTDRRPPQRCVELTQPFNPDLFNFRKVKPVEIIFDLQIDENKELKARGLQNGSVVPSDVTSAVPSERRVDCLLINNAPLTRTHCVFVPDINACRNQVLRRDTIESMLHMLLLSAHPGYRVYYNSLCAFASVNHEHVHSWYSATPVRSDTIQVSSIDPRHNVYVTSDSPLLGFVFELDLANCVASIGDNQLDGSELAKFCNSVHVLIALLLERGMPHNINVCRKWSDELGGQSIEASRKPDTVRVIVWPRKPVVNAEQLENAKLHGEYAVACAELAGLIVVKDVDEFENLTVDQIRLRFGEYSYSADEYRSLIDELLRRLD